MYRIVKHGTYLTEASAWYSAWHTDIAQAMTFWDRGVADAIAEKLEGDVLVTPCLN